MPLIDVADQESIVLRFKIGDRVVCQCGTWQPGTIVKMFYVQRNFPPGKCAPYQVKLDDDTLVFSPADTNDCMRLLDDDGSEEEEGMRYTSLPLKFAGYRRRLVWHRTATKVSTLLKF